MQRIRKQKHHKCIQRILPTETFKIRASLCVKKKKKKDTNHLAIKYSVSITFHWKPPEGILCHLIRNCISRIGHVENDLNPETHWRSYGAGDDQQSHQGKVQPGVREEVIWQTDWHCNSHCLSKHTLITLVHTHTEAHTHTHKRI